MAGFRRSYAPASLRLWSWVSEAMDSKRIAAARSRVYIIVTTIAALLGTVSATGLTPQYTAAEANKHIGEKATVVGEIDCIGHGRRHVDLQIGGCDLQKALLWIVVPNEVSGPELDPEQIRNVTVAVTGKIESSMGTPQITIKSTTQIVPRTALQTNYIGRAYDKEQSGDLDGAMQDLNQAIEHQPARRDEACEHLARVKEKRGDWAGALAAYDRLVALDPNKSGSYYVRATAKKQHGDFEAAMADFTRAAELRSDPAGFTSIGDMRKERGDIAGANAEYDKAIALCDRQIAGTAKTDSASPLGSDPYFSRGYAKELKGDVDGALADYSQAIANNPAKNAMAYGARGNIRKTRGDLTGAISDYQHKYRITNYPDDEKKLNQLRAELKKGGKTAQLGANRNEQSSGTPASAPNGKSLAQQFVEAYSGNDADALAALYAERVDHTNDGVISNAAIKKQAQQYFARWPERQWSLVGSVSYIPIGSSREKIVFSANYDASDPQTKKHASGAAKETLIVAADRNGDLKIVSQKEQISKRSSGQVGDGTSQEPGFNVANQPDTNAFAQAQSDSPECKADAKGNWSEASPDKKLLATIRFVPNPDQHWRAFDDLKASVFRCTPDGKRGQVVASTSIGSLVLQCAHWSPDSRFLLFTTSPSRGGHGGWHYRTFVYCAGDHRFTDDLEDVLGNVLASDFSFESPDIAVLTVSDDQAPSVAGEDWPSKKIRVPLNKLVDKSGRLPSR